MNITTFGAIALAAVSLGSAANAAPVITAVGADLSASAYTFNFQGAGFTFGFNGDYFGGGPITVSTASGGEINTIFGAPTTYFVDRGTVSFGPSMQYAAFGSATPVRFTNGDNFIGLRAVSTSGATYYGFAYTTNNILNSFGFETSPNTTITAVTAVPEPSSWALMIGGFGLAGGAMRRRAKRLSYAA